MNPRRSPEDQWLVFGNELSGSCVQQMASSARTVAAGRPAKLSSMERSRAGPIPVFSSLQNISEGSGVLMSTLWREGMNSPVIISS